MMNPKELLQWLQNLRPWTPPGSTARDRIDNLMNNLKQHLGTPQ